MNLLERFLAYIEEQGLCHPQQHRILVAVSGGRDSMLLAHLFFQAGFEIALAHCNFGLRGEESDGDEALVRQFAEENHIPSFFKRFATKSYAAEQGISTQMAARELRYAWFESVRSEGQFDFIAVAHHANDNVETVLINWLRGTGLRGLRGMLPRSGNLIRPLLFLSSTEVTQAVRDLNIPYRDDSSNFSTEYLRNKLRLEVIPQLQALHPGLERQIQGNVQHLREAETFIAYEMAGLQRELMEEVGSGFYFHFSRIKGHPALNYILFECLRPFQFTTSLCKEIVQGIQAGESATGNVYRSATHALLLDRNVAWIQPLHAELDVPKQGEVEAQLLGTLDVQDSSSSDLVWSWDSRSVQRLHARLHTKIGVGEGEFGGESPVHVQFDADLVRFPLQVRTWQLGDRFQPKGMGGKSKKLSDYFVSKKLARWEKDRIPLVCDAGGQILWVVPWRAAHHAPVKEDTKNVLTISYFCGNGSRKTAIS